MRRMKEFILTGAPEGKNLQIDYAAELNPEQFDVVKGGDGPTLVLAGAGSGKTRTITYRVAWLLEHGIPAENILLLTFTNKASKEMIGRVESLLKGGLNGLWAGTFHSIANRLLRRYASLVGFNNRFSILDQDDSKELIGLIVKEMKLKPVSGRFPSSAVLQSIISYQRNKSCSIEYALEEKQPKFLVFESQIREIAHSYERQKALQNAMDFDDLLVMLLKLLKEHPDVRDALAMQFTYILVDEFQDTNQIQAAIIHELASHHLNLLVVGDDAQSIYSFRAAEIRNILDFPSRYQNAQTFRLTKNYRSTPEILAVANDIIAKNVEQFPKKLDAVVASGEMPNLVPAQNSNQEAQYIAEQILELQEKGGELKNIAVLFRAAYHSQQLEFELMKRDIPYEYRGGLKFFERSHVKDTVAHLRIIHNVKDAMAWIRALKIHPGIGLVTANKIAQKAGEHEEFRDVAHMPPVGRKMPAGWSSFLRIHQKLSAAKPFPADLIRTFVATDEYQSYLENEFPNSAERLEDLEQFSLFAEQFDDLGKFLEAVTLTDEYGAARGEDDEPEDRIVLSTIHQAKGLEWDAVFVMHLAEGMFPGNRAQGSAQMEEERRLFYVAATRARRKLFLTYPITAGFEHAELKQPSPFLEELSNNLIEEVRLRSSLPRPSPSSYAKKPFVGVSDDPWDNEPTIVLDNLGERKKKEPPASFLSDY